MPPVPEGAFLTKNLESFVPSIDARRLPGPGVIAGQNFLFDVDGPRSAFASQFYDWNKWSDDARRNPKSFRVNERYFYGTPEGIFSFDPVSMVHVLQLGVSGDPNWPWTFAKVGNLFYFAQLAVGLWQYNDNTSEWRLISVPGGETVIGICVSYGRLVCLGTETVFWSSLDDGTDFTPSLTTGAGFQPLSLLSKEASRIDAVSDGVIISTKEGWLKGEFVAANYVFRWYAVSTDVHVFSPNMGCIVPDVGLVVLDAKGFHISAGKAPTIWQPDMGAFLVDQYVAKMDREAAACGLLTYSPSAGLLFVSFAPNSREGSFTVSYVYCVASGKWGVFNRQHHGFVEVLTQPYGIDACAYMGTDGYFQFVDDATLKNKEVIPATPYALLDYVQRAVSEPDVRIFSDDDDLLTYFAVGEMHFSDLPPRVIEPISYTGIYEIYGVLLVDSTEIDDLDKALIENLAEIDLGGGLTEERLVFLPSSTTQFYGGALIFEARARAMDEAAIGSIIDIGVFRIAEQKQADETSMVTSLLVGLSQAEAGTQTFNDWMLTDGEHDWNEGVDDVFNDWNEGSVLSDNFELELMATNDGFNPQVQGPELLEVVNDFGSSKQYSPSFGASGIYHRMKFKMLEVDDKIALKTIDLGGTLTGRAL